MALPGQQQTFAMDDCRDMLRKLEWEIDQLGDAQYDVDRLKFGCFNAAVTAWHMAEWVLADTTATQRNVLRIKKNLGALQDKARSECRELYLCYYLANASKHRKVTFHIDRRVNAGVEAGMPTPVYGADVIPTWEAFVDDGDKKRPAIEVFAFALNYWTGIIYHHGIAA
jgi:hypothetical protein